MQGGQGEGFCLRQAQAGAWPCELRRLFGLRKALWCAHTGDTPTPRRGCRGRAESPPACTKRDNFAVSKSPLVGIDAPTPARGQGLQPYGALTLFFRWRKKSVQKKASGTATPGKSPLLPIFERGSSQCRAQHSWTANIYVRARSCSLFSSFKKGKAFSLRCLSPLCSPAVGGGQAYPFRVGTLRYDLDIFASQKASGISKSRWPLLRAMRPVAEWRSILDNRQGAAPN